MKKFTRKAVFVKGVLPRTSVLMVTITRTALIPNREMVLGNQLN